MIAGMYQPELLYLKHGSTDEFQMLSCELKWTLIREQIESINPVIKS